MQDEQDYGARVRAARAYANIDPITLAAEAGVSPRTLARIESGERPLTIPEGRAVAEATGVPLLFLLEGFRFYEAREREFLTEQPREQDASLPAPRGVLGRDLSAGRPSRTDRPGSKPPKAQGNHGDGAG